MIFYPKSSRKIDFNVSRKSFSYYFSVNMRLSWVYFLRTDPRLDHQNEAKAMGEPYEICLGIRVLFGLWECKFECSINLVLILILILFLLKKKVQNLLVFPETPSNFNFFLAFVKYQQNSTPDTWKHDPSDTP